MIDVPLLGAHQSIAGGLHRALERGLEAGCDAVQLLTRSSRQWAARSVPTLLGDPRYALLNAKRVSEMVIDVLVAAEFLFQVGLSEEKRELASTFVHRLMLRVEMAARRISSGDASRLERYDRILGLEK